jgi:hypothetical protein
MVEETGVPGDNHDMPQVTDKLYHIMLYTSVWVEFELTTSVVKTREFYKGISNFINTTLT